MGVPLELGVLAVGGRVPAASPSVTSGSAAISTSASRAQTLPSASTVTSADGSSGSRNVADLPSFVSASGVTLNLTAPSRTTWESSVLAERSDTSVSPGSGASVGGRAVARGVSLTACPPSGGVADSLEQPTATRTVTLSITVAPTVRNRGLSLMLLRPPGAVRCRGAWLSETPLLWRAVLLAVRDGHGDGRRGQKT